MFAKAIQKIEKAMFPIFLTEQVAPNQIKVAVVGTGFFINSDGGFVSVAHVFDNRTPQSKYVFWGYLPNNLQNPPLEITEVSRDDSNDIFFGQVQIKTPHFVSFSKKLAPIGRSVCIAGYPLATITNNSQGGLELGGVRRYFQPSFIRSEYGGTLCKMSFLDHYTSSRLVLPGLHDSLSGFLGDDFYAAAPSKDVLWCFSKYSDKMINEIKEQVNEKYIKNPYPITDKLFTISEEGISIN